MTSKNTLWSISTPAGTHYVLGSIHCLRDEDYPLSAVIETAFEKSSAIIFENNQFEVTSEEVAKLVDVHGNYSDGTLLSDHIDSATFNMLSEKAIEFQLEISLLVGMKPWLIAFVINLLIARKIGLDEKYGIDKVLAERAKTSQKELRYLETVEEQLEFLDNLPNEAQELLLTQALTSKEIENTFTAITSAWKSGDLEALGGLLLRFAHAHPEVQENLITQRNRRWLPQIEEYLLSEGTKLVIVGAAHLVGPNGLIKTLEENGYHAEQL